MNKLMLKIDEYNCLWNCVDVDKCLRRKFVKKRPLGNQNKALG